MARDTWYRLDSVGKFYSSQAGSTAQTVFRLSATLVDDIEEEVLQRAVERTIQVFPSFNVCLRSGMFWHYLEQASGAPEVHLENLPICYGLHVDTKSILFRVSYYRERINFEVSHIVSDGRGAMNFFKTLIQAYIQDRYAIKDLSFEYDGSDTQKSENSFDKYYDRSMSSSDEEEEGQDNERQNAKVYRLSGFHDKGDPTYMEFHLGMKSVHTLARAQGVSMTALMIAVLVHSIRFDMRQRDRHREIRVGIPVDLRQVFSSTTTKNFFGLATLSYLPAGEESVEELAGLMNEKLKEATTPERLTSRVNRLVSLEKNPILRFAPLFIKDLILEIADWVNARDVTTSVSNLGRVSFDERLSPYIRDVNVLTSTTGLSFTICSFGDDLSIGISTLYSNLDILKHFCRYFASQGIEGVLNISKTSEEVAADWREAQLEKRLVGQGSSLDEDNDNTQAPVVISHECSDGSQDGEVSLREQMPGQRSLL